MLSFFRLYLYVIIRFGVSLHLSTHRSTTATFIIYIQFLLTLDATFHPGFAENRIGTILWFTKNPLTLSFIPCLVGSNDGREFIWSAKKKKKKIWATNVPKGREKITND